MRAHKHLLADTEPPSSPFALFGFVAPDQTKTAAEFAPPAVCVGVCATVARTSFRVFEPETHDVRLDGCQRNPRFFDRERAIDDFVGHKVIEKFPLVEDA